VSSLWPLVLLDWSAARSWILEIGGPAGGSGHARVHPICIKQGAACKASVLSGASDCAAPRAPTSMPLAVRRGIGLAVQTSMTILDLTASSEVLGKNRRLRI